MRFQGIYRIKPDFQQGPSINKRFAREVQHILAINTVNAYKKENIDAAYLLVPNRPTYLFVDDDKGNHYDQFRTLTEPMRDDKSPIQREKKGLDLHRYNHWTSSEFMEKLSHAGRALLELIEKTPVYPLNVVYSILDKAKYYNHPNWQGGTLDQRTGPVQSAVSVEQIRELPLERRTGFTAIKRIK